MNVRPQGENDFRKLRADELRKLTSLADFRAAQIRDEAEWNQFFDRFRPRREKEENRSKRESLHDIAAGKMPGRAEFCKEHLAERERLLRQGKTDGDPWANLNQKRILGPDDAPPSLRAKTDAVCARVLRMAKDAGINPADIASVAVESARFDIASLSAAEGRKLKKSEYGKKRVRARDDLAAEQENLCAYCAGRLAFGWTADHVFPRRGGGGDAAKNRVAACAACNAEKWRFEKAKLHPKALDALDRRNPAKAQFLRKELQDGRALASATLAAAQSAMTGGKILSGALAVALFARRDDKGKISREQRERALQKTADPEIFPTVRAADAAMLRRIWFPNTDRCKRALRAAEDDFTVRVEAGKTREIKRAWADIDPKPGRAVPAFIRSAPTSGNILLAPQRGPAGEPGDIGVHSVPLKPDIRTLTVLPADSRKKKLKPWEAVAGKPREIDLAAAKVRGLLEAIDDRRPTDSGLPLKWKRAEGVLTVTAEKPGEHKLRFAPRLRIAVPPPNNPDRQYHHAVDAVVAAALPAADWRKIIRMERETAKRPPRKRREFWRTADSGKPRTPDGQPFPDRAPDDDAWLIPARPASKGGPKRRKTGRNPLARAKINGREFLVQRVPLDRLPAENFQKEFPTQGAVVPAARKIRDALRDAWEEIQDLPDEERDEMVSEAGGKKHIAQKWFLARPRGHILHPARVRSVPVVKFEDTQTAFLVQRGDAVHRFKREEHWGEVVQWRAPDGETGFCRRRPKWYRNKLNPEWDRSEKDFRPPPDGAKIIARFRRGLHLRCDGQPGLWRITELGLPYAALAPADHEARRTAQARPKQAKIGTVRPAGTAETPPGWRPQIGDRVEWEKTPGVWKVVKSAKRVEILTADDRDSRRWMQNREKISVEYAGLRRV